MHQISQLYFNAAKKTVRSLSFQIFLLDPSSLERNSGLVTVFSVYELNNKIISQ